MAPKHVQAVRALLAVALADGDRLGESWLPILQCTSQLARLQARLLRPVLLCCCCCFVFDALPAHSWWWRHRLVSIRPCSGWRPYTVFCSTAGVLL